MDIAFVPVLWISMVWLSSLKDGTYLFQNPSAFLFLQMHILLKMPEKRLYLDDAYLWTICFWTFSLRSCKHCVPVCIMAVIW